MINHYIIMNLEWNYPETRYRSVENGVKLNGEIIQIGAVKTDRDLNVIDRFMKIVVPTVYPKVNKFVSELTEISTEMVREGSRFEEAIAEFLSWCGERCAFLTWGENDIYMLEENIIHAGVGIRELPECYDIQLMFDDQITQADRSMPLNYAMWKFDIKPARAHDALNDAENTLEVLKRLDLSEGIEDYLI